MANRKEAADIAVKRSVETEETPTKKAKRRQGNIAALYASWGGDDCNFFFRWAGAEIGQRAQSMELPAETVFTGKRPLPFWDHSLGDLPFLKRKLERLEMKLRDASAKRAPALHAEIELLRARIVGGHGSNGDVRAGSASGSRARTNPERLNENNLKAAKRYGRVKAGMRALAESSPAKYDILSATFLPRRLAPEIEREWRQLAWLAIHSDRVQKAHVSAKEREPELTLETFVLRRIEKGDDIVKLAMEDAEAAALAAIRAYEAVAAPPKEIELAMRDDEEKTARAPRKSVVGGAFAPAGWGR